MPFYTYSCKPETNNTLHFQRQRGVRLAGHGLITSAAKEQGFLGKDEKGKRFTAEQLLKGEKHVRIVSDVTPGRSDEINLMSIEFVSCYAYRSWMPLLFHMVQVGTGDNVTDKKKFSYENKKSDLIRSFVYITLRTDKGGVWQWGRTGGVNGPLLWPAAMKFFQQEIESIGYRAQVSV